MMKTSSLLLAVLGSSISAFAQAPGAQWSQTQTSANPPLRRENPGTSNFTHMFVFGGQSGTSGGTAMNDLWQFDGVSWQQMTADGAAGSPPARVRCGVCWDFARNKLVVFGGNDVAGSLLADTWEWDPNTNIWTDVTPVSGNPTARRFCPIAFDPTTSRVILFGGLDSSGTHLNDTWAFDGASWSQLSPTNVPSTRRQHQLVTRLDQPDILMFGGQDASLPASQKWRTDTWRWDGANWNQITTTDHPDGQVANDAAYDMVRRRVVVTGGNGTGGTPTGTTAEFDSRTNDWVVRPTDPGIFKTSRYFLAFIAAAGRTYKVSGQALNATTPPVNTYEYQSANVATVTTGSPGCATSSGTPELRSLDLPWVGTTLDLEVTNTPGGSTTLLAMGFTTTSITMASLGLGSSSCVITVSPILGIPAPISGSTGRPTVSIPIPNDNALVGAGLLNQAIILDAGAGFVSNRADVVFGAL